MTDHELAGRLATEAGALILVGLLIASFYTSVSGVVKRKAMWKRGER